MTVRKYSSRAQQTTLSSPITSSATTMTVVNASALMGGKTLTGTQTYTVVIDPDTALEEIVDVTVYASGSTLTITRGVDAAGAGVAHSAGAVVRHMAIGRDYQEANDHIENVIAAHGLTIANVLETTDTNMITTAMLQTNAVTTTKITDANVTTAKIADSAITSAKIADLGIATGDIADLAITTGKLADAAVTTGKITDGAVTEAKIVTSGVTTTKIADSAVTSAKIADGTIVAGDIADGAITSAKIAAGAVETADLADSAVTSAKIADGTIVAGDLADGAVTSAKILNDTIVNADVNTSAQIAYGKLNLSNSIVDGDVNASAAIAWTKIAPSSLVSATELGYVDGVTSPIQTQLDSKLATATAATTYAPLASPALTGTPTAPTAAANTNTTQVATTAYVQTEIADLIASAPGALDTLDELAAALGDDANFATTVTNSIATKLPLAGGTMTGAIAMGGSKITGLGTPTVSTDAATKGYIDTASIAPSNLTGPITSVGPATSVAAQTGTGSTFVMNTSPTLVTPILGVATATSINSTVIPTSKTLVATDSTQYVVPSQTGNSGKYLTTNGTASSWAYPVAPITTATTLNSYTSFSQVPYGGQQLNVFSNQFYLAPYGSFTSGDADIFNAAFPVGSVVTASDSTQSGTFTVASAGFINGGGYLVVPITTSEPSTIFFSGATTLTAGVSTAGKYLTNDGTTSSWANATGAMAGTYTLTTITVDANGKITAVSSGTAQGETFNPLMLMGA